MYCEVGVRILYTFTVVLGIYWVFTGNGPGFCMIESIVAGYVSREISPKQPRFFTGATPAPIKSFCNFCQPV